jgi:hypothetical protein
MGRLGRMGQTREFILLSFRMCWLTELASENIAPKQGKLFKFGTVGSKPVPWLFDACCR